MKRRRPHAGCERSADPDAPRTGHSVEGSVARRQRPRVGEGHQEKSGYDEEVLRCGGEPAQKSVQEDVKRFREAPTVLENSLVCNGHVRGERMTAIPDRACIGQTGAGHVKGELNRTTMPAIPDRVSTGLTSAGHVNGERGESIAEPACGSESEVLEPKGMHFSLSQDDKKWTLGEVHDMCEPQGDDLRHAITQQDFYGERAYGSQQSNGAGLTRRPPRILRSNVGW